MHRINCDKLNWIEVWQTEQFWPSNSSLLYKSFSCRVRIATSPSNCILTMLAWIPPRVTIWGSSVICHPTRFICHPIWSDEQMTDHLTRWSVHPSDLDVKFIYQLYISKSLILYVFKCALQIYLRPQDRFRRPIFTSPWRNCLDRNFVQSFQHHGTQKLGVTLIHPVQISEILLLYVICMANHVYLRP